MIKKNLFLLSILPLLFSCSNKECECIDKALKTKLPTEYKNKVNRATFNYLGMYYSNGETEYLDSAIMILNQAIEISHTLFPAYYFKSIVYEAKGDYGSIIITVDSAIKYSYTDPNMLFFKARALDHLGMAEEADNVLESAERLYSQWIYCYPDSISFIISRIGFTAYYKGKTVAIKEINNYIKEYPNDDIIVGIKNMIENEPEDSELFRKKNELMNQL